MLLNNFWTSHVSGLGLVLRAWLQKPTNPIKKYMSAKRNLSVYVILFADIGIEGWAGPTVVRDRVGKPGTLVPSPRKMVKRNHQPNLFLRDTFIEKTSLPLPMAAARSLTRTSFTSCRMTHCSNSISIYTILLGVPPDPSYGCLAIIYLIRPFGF